MLNREAVLGTKKAFGTFDANFRSLHFATAAMLHVVEEQTKSSLGLPTCYEAMQARSVLVICMGSNVILPQVDPHSPDGDPDSPCWHRFPTPIGRACSRHWKLKHATQNLPLNKRCREAKAVGWRWIFSGQLAARPS